jgi:hypothetical protein
MERLRQPIDISLQTLIERRVATMVLSAGKHGIDKHLTKTMRI